MAARGCRNEPLRGGKGTWWEGGIRVPFILSWPGQVTAGKRYVEPVMSFDLFATFLTSGRRDAGGVVDGVNLLPFLRGGSGVPHPYLFWGGKWAGATRKGNWKLVGNELYDLGNDIGERSNVAGAHRTGRGPAPSADRVAAARSSRNSGERARRSAQYPTPASPNSAQLDWTRLCRLERFRHLLYGGKQRFTP